MNVALDQALALLRERLPQARWVPAENRHLTLVFLGTVEAQDLEWLDDSLASACASESPFGLEVGDLGIFPEGRPGRVAWLGFQPCPALNRLRQAVVDACVALDRDLGQHPYVPHLTLARCRRPWPRRTCDDWRKANSDVRRTAFRSAGFGVSRGCFFESVQEPGGVRYSVVRSYPLGRREPEPGFVERGSQ